MPLTSSFFVPHSPILMHTIGKEHRSVLKKTLKSFETIQNFIKKEKVDTAIVLSAHTSLSTKTINLNLAKEYKTDLKEFGDLVTQTVWYPDIALLGLLRANAEHKYDVNLVTQEHLDYGSSIPLELLFAEKPTPRIVPITFAKLPLPEVYKFGKFLYEHISAYPQKVVVIATGDLSHKLTTESPSGYSPHAKAFDNQVKRALKEKNVSTLSKISEDTLENVGQCGIRSLLILSSLFEKKNYTPIELSYEHPFGVGYLTACYMIEKK